MKFSCFSLIVFIVFFTEKYLSQIPATTSDGKKVILYENNYWEYANSTHPFALYFPAIQKNDYIIHHSAYSLSYDTIHHLAKWAIYKISKEQLNNKQAERTNKFTADPYLPKSTDFNIDYKNSGYDKGHLVPAADMSFSEISMKESFYFTNMTPQVPSFNRGIWKKLEEQVRNWTEKYNELIVVTGAVITDTMTQIGIHKISVPHLFYKIVACVSCSEINGIAFIMPNKKSDMPVQHYAVSIDSVEKITHINFFSALDDVTEEKLEKNISVNFWWK